MSLATGLPRSGFQLLHARWRSELAREKASARQPPTPPSTPQTRPPPAHPHLSKKTAALVAKKIGQKFASEGGGWRRCPAAAATTAHRLAAGADAVFEKKRLPPQQGVSSWSSDPLRLALVGWLRWLSGFVVVRPVRVVALLLLLPSRED